MTNLSQPIETVFRISKAQFEALRKLGIFSVRDLIWHFPSRYEDFSNLKRISELADKEHAVTEGKITKLELKKTWGKRVPITRGYIEDPTGKIELIWFHQPYISFPISFSGDIGNSFPVPGEMRTTAASSFGKKG